MLNKFLLFSVDFHIVSNISEIEEPTEGNQLTLFCDYPEIDPKYLKSLKWYKNDFEILNLANVTIEGKKLMFSYLNHSIYNGLYKCQIELTNRQNLSSNDYNMKIHCKPK